MPELLFHASIRHDAHGAVVEAMGELDISTTPLLREAIEAALRSGPKSLLVDLRNTTFFAGVGAELLFDALERCSESGIALGIAPGPAAERVLALLGFPADALRPRARSRHRFALGLHGGGRDQHRREGAARRARRGGRTP